MSVSKALNGYDYQVDVSVWLVLDLLLARKAANRVEIEPEATLEDLAVEVKESRAGVQIESRGWQVQVKSRGKHWTVEPFAQLLLGEDEYAASSKRRKQRKDGKPVDPLPAPKPRRRAPPVERLASSTDSYVLITSAQASELDQFRVEAVGDVPKAPYLTGVLLDSFAEEQLAGRYAKLDVAGLAGRIAVIDHVTTEVLEARIDRILRADGHVPIGKRQACRMSIEAQVWDRMRGQENGPLTLAIIETILRKNDGRLQADPELRNFVRPSVLPQVEERLRSANAVLIIGEAGVGKTTCARFVCEALRQVAATHKEPYRVVHVYGPGDIVGELERDDPTVFLIHDPWGRISDEEATFPTSKVLSFLDRADANRKFVVTSPTAAYNQRTTKDERERLDRHRVRLPKTSYSPQTLRELLVRSLGQRGGAQADWLRDEADILMRHLGLPWEVGIAARDLGRTWDADPDAWPDPIKIASSSRREAIAARLTEEIRARKGASSVDAFLVLAELSENKTLEQTWFNWLQRRLQRDPALRDVRPADFTLWLVDRGTLKGTKLTAHALEIQGIQAATAELGVQGVRVGDRLGPILELLVDADEGKRALTLWRHWDEDDIDLNGGYRARLLDVLRNALADATDEDSFRRDLWTLRERGDRDNPVERALDALLFEGTETRRRGFGWSFSLKSKWIEPDWTDAEFQAVRDSRPAQRAAQALLRLHFGHHGGPPIEYDRLISFLLRLGWDVSGDCIQAFPRALSPSCIGGEVLVWGASSGDQPPWETLLQQGLTEMHRVEERWEEDKKPVEDDTADENWAEHIADDASNSGWAVESALTELLNQWRTRRGYQSLVAHPQRGSLLRYWAGSVRDAPGRNADHELAEIVETSAAGVPRTVWEAAVRWPGGSLTPHLLARLETATGDDLAGVLSALRAAHGEVELRAALDGRVRTISLARAVELRCAAHEATMPGTDRERQYELGALLDSLLPDVARLFALLNDGDLAATNADLHGLEAVVRGASDSIASRALVALAARSGAMPDDLLRFLSGRSKEVRLNVAQALALWATTESLDLLRESFLRDPAWEVRLCAVEAVSVRPTPAAREALLLLSKAERSKHVRRALADAIGRNRWPEGLPALLAMLTDRADWNPDPYRRDDDEADLRVASAAARALSEFPALDEATIGGLESFLRGGAAVCTSVRVHQSVLRTLHAHAPERARAASAPLGRRSAGRRPR